MRTNNVRVLLADNGSSAQQVTRESLCTSPQVRGHWPAWATTLRGVHVDCGADLLAQVLRPAAGVSDNVYSM